MRDDGSMQKKDVDISIIKTLLQGAMNNICADIEDVRKAPVTLYILLKRECLKEIRRYWFWVITFFRAIALGVVIGIACYLLIRSSII